ncbi:ABC-F family ATP-binding cassette domain-containing protein [Frigoribacterium sp. 2-23]|uniref:ABC-F family ATP-binding cassette domain-containing protein n=1 Tax=Frigoribacterium sp. 2-23 TaxID=3415006 RepID=UPI003C70382F
MLQRVERDRMAAASESKRQNLMRKELAWLRRGAPARTSKPKFRIDAANELIENEPPVRDKVELSQMATARLGKDVVDLVEVGVSFGDKRVLEGVEWRIAPGERTGVLGVNGAGKSTLLKVVTGAVAATEGRVKQGKTVKFAVLDQQLADLHEVAHERVSDVIGRQRTSYVTGGKEMTPGQLLERLGLTSAQLQTPIKDLSGGQKRRLQFLLILLDEPNVLILDEPTNDLDTDMLAAMEDLLDSWPGTLLVVSHDRYLLERVTDQQYAVLDGRFRHLPGGVDQYLELRRQATATQGGATDRPTASQGAAASGSGLSGAELRNAQKELGSIDRKLAKAAGEREALLAQFATFDQSDFDGLAVLQAKLTALDHKTGELEVRWLELSELLG